MFEGNFQIFCINSGGFGIFKKNPSRVICLQIPPPTLATSLKNTLHEQKHRKSKLRSVPTILSRRIQNIIFYIFIIQSTKYYLRSTTLCGPHVKIIRAKVNKFIDTSFITKNAAHEKVKNRLKFFHFFNFNAWIELHIRSQKLLQTFLISYLLLLLLIFMHFVVSSRAVEVSINGTWTRTIEWAK